MTTTHDIENEKERFGTLVRAGFRALEDTGGMSFGGVSIVGGGDPRDHALVVRYSRDDLRAEIGWNEIELALAVLLQFKRADLGRKESYVYFEPFVQFLTRGEAVPLVPFVADGMSLRQLRRVAAERAHVFAGGVEPVLQALGARMTMHFDQIARATLQEIRGYHDWMAMQSSQSKR